MLTFSPPHSFGDFIPIDAWAYEKFIKCYEYQREKSLKDKNFIFSPNIIYSIREIINLKNGTNDFLLYSDNDVYPIKINIKSNPSPYLYVIFSGNRQNCNEKVFFNRWSWHKFFPAHTIFVSDPMFFKYGNLHLGWYYGDEKKQYLKTISDIVQHISSLLGVKTRNIISYGSSGGGYAALKFTHYISDSNAIAINPQIDISNYENGTKSFCKITGINLKSQKDFHCNNIFNIIQSSDANYLIIQNILDKHDLEAHLFPLSKNLDLSLKFGLNITENQKVLVYLYEALGSHSMQEDEYLLYFWLNLATSFFYHKNDFFKNYTEYDNFYINLALLYSKKFAYRQSYLIWKQRFLDYSSKNDIQHR